MEHANLRPMSVGAIVDRTFKLYRKHFVPIILFSLLIGGIANLIVNLIAMGGTTLNTTTLYDDLYRAISSGDYTTILSLVNAYSSAATSGSFLSLLVSLLITPIVTGGIAFITLASSTGEDAQPKSWFERLKATYLKLIGTNLLSSVLLFLCMFVFIFILTLLIVAISFSGAIGVALFLVFALALALVAMVSIYLALLFPVMVQEGAFGFRAIGRTLSLMFRKFWKSLGVILLTSIIVLVVSEILGLIVAFLPAFISTILTVAFSALLTPISAIAASLLYLDIRVTTEGYDLELRTQAMESGAQEGFEP